LFITDYKYAEVIVQNTANYLKISVKRSKKYFQENVMHHTLQSYDPL